MKRKLFFQILLLAGILNAAPAWTTEEKATEQVKQEGKEMLQALSGYTVEQRDEALRAAKTALDSLDTRIEALEKDVDTRWDSMDKVAREQARASLKELHKQRAQASEWYGSLKSSTGAAWEHMKKGFSEAYNDLSAAWKKSKQEFNPEK
jgi:hypothetical protein